MLKLIKKYTLQEQTEYLQDVIADMFANGIQSGISVNYNDSDGTLDLYVSTSSSGISEMITTHSGNSYLHFGDCIDIEYANLVTTVSNSQLIPSKFYRITDHRTTFTIPATSSGYAAELEPLIVQAVTKNQLSMVAYSELYPQDIIHYNLRNDLLQIGDGADTNCLYGYILFRRDTLKDIECYCDFRHVVYRRWESELGSGIYDLTGDWAETGSYMDFPMFCDYENSSECRINQHRDSGDNGPHPLGPNVVFRGTAYKVTMPYGDNGFTFLGYVENTSFGPCSGGLFYGNVSNYVALLSGSTMVTGDVDSFISLTPTVIVHGNAYNSIVLPTAPVTDFPFSLENRLMGGQTLVDIFVSNVPELEYYLECSTPNIVLGAGTFNLNDPITTYNGTLIGQSESSTDQTVLTCSGFRAIQSPPEDLSYLKQYITYPTFHGETHLFANYSSYYWLGFDDGINIVYDGFLYELTKESIPYNGISGQMDIYVKSPFVRYTPAADYVNNIGTLGAQNKNFILQNVMITGSGSAPLFTNERNLTLKNILIKSTDSNLSIERSMEVDLHNIRMASPDNSSRLSLLSDSGLHINDIFSDIPIDITNTTYYTLSNVEGRAPLNIYNSHEFKIRDSHFGVAPNYITESSYFSISNCYSYSDPGISISGSHNFIVDSSKVDTTNYPLTISGACSYFSVRNNEWTTRTLTSGSINKVLIPGDKVLCDTLSEGAFTVYLPEVNSSDSPVYIKDKTNNFSNNKLTVNSNGKKIRGEVQDLILDINGANVEFSYLNDAYGWQFSLL